MKRRWMTTLAVALTLMTRAIAAEETPPPLSPEQRALRIEAISKSAFGENLPQICDKKTIDLRNSNIDTQRIGKKTLRNGINAAFCQLISKSDLSRVFTDELINSDGKFYFGKDKVFQVPFNEWEYRISVLLTVPDTNSGKPCPVSYNQFNQTINIFNAANKDKFSHIRIDAKHNPEEFARLKKQILEESAKQYDNLEKQLPNIAAGKFEIPDLYPSEDQLQEYGTVTVVEVDGEEALQIEMTQLATYISETANTSSMNKYQKIIRRRDGVLLRTTNFDQDGQLSRITIYSNYSFDVPDSAFAVPEGLQIVKCKDNQDYYSKPDNYDWDGQQSKYAPLVEAKYMTSYPVLPGMTRQPIIVIPSSPWKPRWLWIVVGGAVGAIIGGTSYIIQKRRNA